jgi:TetR/AcrR family transcriptional repressor of nem operon
MDGHITLMARASNREKILTEGLRVVHRHGFGGASVRDIVQAAGVPQGSFTNHFTSKEAFGLEILDLYFAQSRGMIDASLRNDALPPLQRLADYIDLSKSQLNETGMRDGCLLGNFAAEATDRSEDIRVRLVEIFAELRKTFAECLRAAVAAGELRADFDCDGTAAFILSGLQGANLMAKVARSPEPVERFKQTLFATILR